MEFTKVEILAVQGAEESNEADVKELSELQMALVGGGCGEVVFH